MAAAIVNVTGADGFRPTAPLGHLKISLTGPTSYATGGITGAAALVIAAAAADGIKLAFTKDEVLGIVPIDCKGYTIAYDTTNDTFIWYYGDNDGGADGPAVQVANAANLDAVTVQFTLLIGS